MSQNVAPSVNQRGSRWPDRQQLKVLLTLSIAILLWFLPSLLLPRLMVPIDMVLRTIGLLKTSAGSFESGFAATLVLRWLAVVLLLLFVISVEREPLSSIGIRALRWRDATLAIGIGFLGLCVGATLYLLVNGGPQTSTSTQTGSIMRTLGIAGRIHLIVNAAVVEEMFFRGTLMECLIRAFGRPWLAGIISFLLFVGGHYLSGSASLAQTLTIDVTGGLVLVWLYLLRRNVLLCMIAHAIMDAIVLFV